MKYRSMQEKKIIIKCFGKLAIYVDGIEQSALMKSLKARELIAFLLTYKGEAVCKTTVCNALWADKPEEYGKDSLYKLVRKIEKMPIPFMLDNPRGMIQLRLDNIDCDIVLFEHLLEEDDIKKKERAVDLYRGTLFQEENYDWIYLKDARYDTKYFDMVNYLYSYFEEENNRRKALYYKGLMDDYIYLSFRKL